MRIVALRTDQALCAQTDGDGLAEIDIRLVPEVREGDWLLVFLGAARRIISAKEAHAIADALAALEAVMRGGSLDAHFIDLADREPQLPEHMEQARRDGAATV
jgi:hydrogenase expression/formation protein HypC